MDLLKKKRTPLRSQWTRTMKKIEELMAAKPLDLEAVTGHFEMVEPIALEVEELSRQINDLMLEGGASEKDVDEEMEKTADYRASFCVIKKRVEKLMHNADQTNDDASVSATSTMGMNRSYHLPKMKLKEFSGEFKDWLGWWAQYKRIHDDPSLDTSTKFQFLDMAIVKGSKARAVIDVFPMSDENYPKAIKALKYRFGRDELQVEVYVRELIKLLIINVNSKDKLEVSKLYDQLGSHLKALESFGVTAEKNDAILYPLMESCLPVGVLRAWERSDLSKMGSDKDEEKDGARKKPKKAKLEYLMEFLQGEVESEQRISLAVEGFGTKEAKPEVNSKGKFTGKVRKSEEGRQATAAGLVNEVDKSTCVFCSGAHSTDNCGQARNMTLVDKKEKLKKFGCCFKCTRKGCWAKKCDSEVVCYVCGRKHHTLLCSGSNASSDKGGNKTPKPEDNEKSAVDGIVTNSAANVNASGEVYLQTAIVEIVSGGRRMKVRALFDTGSQRTHIKSSTARELGLEVEGTETLTHVLFGGSKSEVRHNRYQIAVKTKDASHQLNMSALDQEIICNKLPSVPKGPWMSQLRERGIWLEDMDKSNEDIQMLIGGDVYGSLLTGRMEKLPCGLTAVETKLGWTVMGTFNSSKGAPSTNHSMVVTSLMVSQLSVPDLWRLETIGIQDPIELKTREEEEAEVMHRFKETVKRNPDGRYVVKLPWRCDVPDLPTNRIVAEKRLNSTTKKLKSSVIGTQSEGLLDVPESASLPTRGADWDKPSVKVGFNEYDKVFREWLKEDIIEEIPDDDSKKCHYLPHRAVIKEESMTTKVRPVFDASCKSGRAPSLNDCLEKGPNLVDLIPSVMHRFRTGWVGVISDIRKAFLMIEVNEKDRDYLRFLWWEEGNGGRMKVFRHKRVVFGVNSSPFLLGAVIQYHLSQYTGDWVEVAEKITRSLYVDNCVASVNSRKELTKFREASTTIMAEAGMDLRMWQDSLDVSEDMDDRVVPVLGMKWDRFTDELFCDVPSTDVNLDQVTKRQILSVTAQIFDPLGIVCPVTVQPKLLLQETWMQKKGWDEIVEEQALNTFGKWTKELPQLSQIKIPRCFRSHTEDTKGWGLHCFTDASSYAYGAVVFLRCEGQPVTVQLLQAKARVAPLKKAKKNLSIPRLELVGCLIGARLATAVIKALDVNDIPCYFWSDSSTALSWIRRNDDWGTFVGNRVREILALSQANQWYHVPGKLNPADLPSRGCNATELLASKWWEGPDWLKMDPEDWPQEELQVNEEEVLQERKKSVASTVAGTVGGQWYLRGWSGYTRMIRRAAYVFRFEDLITKRSIKNVGELSQEEIEKAEKRLVQTVQEEAFGELKLPKNLKVIRDGQGIYRVKTKLLNRQDHLDFRTPMLLPSSHPFVTELIREVHLKNAHAGAQALISILREKFWIFHTRTAVNDVIGKCQRCLRYKAKNVEVESAPLPEDRVRDADVFEFTGVDCAGPLYLRNGKKAWIVLFTCAVFRAVHLELVTSLDTRRFLQAMRRFIRRRRRPAVIYSDNGTNFRGAVNLFKKIDWENVKKNSTVAPIKWKFSPPSAPWWGGFWERMVRNVKELLVRVLGRSSVDYEELNTILIDVESVVNQRPLTVMTEDGDDLVALTPAMFVNGVREAGVPEIDEIDREGLVGKYKAQQDLLDQLRSRFRTEYLANLLDKVKQKPNYELRVGDLVIIGEDNRKRLDWQLGRIEGFIGKRIAKLKTSSGGCTRPVRRLYPMELNPADDEHKPEVEAFTRRGRKIRKPVRFQ